ncbi:hypothetical protein [Desulfosarcina ovata]|uniref:hypothetical protein n=1 Tax=Desulfosarcina ovata TaxID=83564 RepID=UPI0012D2D1FC|nr:hypothetical protein [Desulfosarcina ovata]
MPNAEKVLRSITTSARQINPFKIAGMGLPFVDPQVAATAEIPHGCSAKSEIEAPVG